MRNPENFGGCSGVLNTAMVLVSSGYIATGFFGYLKYGDDVSMGELVILNIKFS